MTIDDTKKVDMAREDRLRDMSKEPVRTPPKDADFNKILERSRLASNPTQTTQPQSKTVTEEAIREAARHDERHGEDRRRDEDDGKGRRDSRQKGERAEARFAGHKVMSKAQTKQHGGSDGSRQGGYGTAGRRELSRALSRSAAKSVPVDLQGKFAAKLESSLKGADAAHQPAITQQILNKIVQYVRIGINRKGEKEMQMDLHENVFRGLKLRVTSRDGKVSVHFRTADKKGRAVFEKNAGAIRDALQKKGIEVDEIIVS
ncbi:MAG: flagellar hook-length control protein FliK [Pseudomonadota bacterium]